MQVDVTVRGDQQAIALLGRLSHRLEDGRPQLLGLVEQIVDAQEERFAGQGIRWRRPAESTRRKDTQQGRDRRTLVLTGALMRSLTRVGAPGQIIRVRPGVLTFGTSIYYARFHHRGQGSPRRTVVGLTRMHKKRVVDELRSLLLEDT